MNLQSELTVDPTIPKQTTKFQDCVNKLTSFWGQKSWSNIWHETKVREIYQKNGLTYMLFSKAEVKKLRKEIAQLRRLA